MPVLVAIALLVLGVLLLSYRGFSYTKEKHEARVAGFGVSLKERRRVEVPAWVGAVVTLAGGAILAAEARRRHK
jgi:heme/copper-type cytochrome/quinol oxidase subunit 2